MKAVVCKELGGTDKLVVEDIQPGELGHTDVRVAVHACGVNFLDTLTIIGQYQDQPDLPFTPGVEIAGEIIEVGPGVHNFKPGERVLGFVQSGGFAEEVIASSMQIITIPDDMSYKDAAAFPIAYGTSHLALTHRGRLQPGETLLVYGAAGGVGLTAVEIGNKLGATVIACASSAEKLELTERYGATYTINYTKEDIRERVKTITGGKGADVIYDPVGGDAFKSGLRAINWEGRILVIGFASGDIPEVPVNLTLVKNCAIVGVYWGAYMQRNPEVLMGSLETLLSWYDGKTLHPHISQTYTLDEVPQALEAMQSRQSTGKLVVVVREDPDDEIQDE